jgi:FAD binding domain
MYIYPYGILVNKERMRFTDEGPGPTDETYEDVTRNIHAQPSGIAWKLRIEDTDPIGQVVNKQGDAIPGLYAVGETQGLYYGAYTGATSVLKGLVFGRLAGYHAAQHQSKI